MAMLKVLVTLLVLAAGSLGQNSVNNYFVVQHAGKTSAAFSDSRLHEAEKLYFSACDVVQRDFHVVESVRPHFTLVLGAERNEFHNATTIWLKDWDPALFTQAVVVMAYYQMLTTDMQKQLTRRALEYANASVSVGELKDHH
jgi:hypothetical protein